MALLVGPLDEGQLKISLQDLLNADKQGLTVDHAYC